MYDACHLRAAEVLERSSPISSIPCHKVVHVNWIDCDSSAPHADVPFMMNVCPQLPFTGAFVILCMSNLKHTPTPARTEWASAALLVASSWLRLKAEIINMRWGYQKMAAACTGVKSAWMWAQNAQSKSRALLFRFASNMHSAKETKLWQMKAWKKKTKKQARVVNDLTTEYRRGLVQHRDNESFANWYSSVDDRSLVSVMSLWHQRTICYQKVGNYYIDCIHPSNPSFSESGCGSSKFSWEAQTSISPSRFVQLFRDNHRPARTHNSSTIFPP